MIPTKKIVYLTGVDVVLLTPEGRHDETIAEWDADSGDFIDDPWEPDPEYREHMRQCCQFEWERNQGMVGRLDE